MDRKRERFLQFNGRSAAETKAFAEYVMEVLRIAGCYGDELPPQMKEQIRQMAYANRIWQKPDHTQPVTGDSEGLMRLSTDWQPSGDGIITAMKHSNPGGFTVDKKKWK